MSKRITAASPKRTARIAGLFYVVVFVLGIFSLSVRGPAGYATAMIAGGFYIAVTVLFYFIFRPVKSNNDVSSTIGLYGPFGQTFGELARTPSAEASTERLGGRFVGLLAFLN